MGYPDKILLTKTRRRIILGGFFAGFILITPIIILFTTGRHYDFKNKRFTLTGVLSVDALPLGTQVKINGQEAGTIPVYRPSLSPGQYQIFLSAPEFYDWQKDVLVEGKKTTYVVAELLKHSTVKNADEPNLMASSTAVRFTDSERREWQYDSLTSAWYATTDFEVWRLVNNNAPELLTRQSEKVRAVNVLTQTGTLLLTTDRGLVAYDPKNDYRQELTAGDIKTTLVDTEKRTIHFFGIVQKKSGWFLLEY